MKFERITINNFMRYKGENTIEFSCDDEKNVTIVLGDNSVGKTTLAQAFRFGLYGDILVEAGKKRSDYNLLNNEVADKLKPNSYASMYVEISMLSDRERYILRREVQYALKSTRKGVEMSEASHSIRMYEYDINDYNIKTEIKSEKIDSVVNEMFPKNMSNYFLFDGEKWRDIRVNGISDSIKDSVHTLTGLSNVKSAMNHLKDFGTASAISKMKRNVKGSGQIYDNIQREKESMERKRENLVETIKSLNISIKNHENAIEEINLWLEENRSTEDLQKNIKHKNVIIGIKEKNVNMAYKSFRDTFNNEPWCYFSRPMIENALEILKKNKSERRDIPYIHQSTIDYLIKRGQCLCGTVINEKSEAIDHLLKEREYLPPADIGSLLGTFEKTGNRWLRKYDDFKTRVLEKANDQNNAITEYDNAVMDLQKYEKISTDNSVFVDKRSNLKYHRDKINSLNVELGITKEKIRNYEDRIIACEHDMKNLELQNENNRVWRERIEFAEAVYDSFAAEYKEKEKNIFVTMNEGLQKNFANMFNAKDKKIYLDEKYNIIMSYKNINGGNSIENNLSEGEKVARNFAFIVTIMEYTKKNKKTSNDIDTLPLVLDGPFSKLGAENIELVAGVLPEMSEQVIIFMLEKDWKHTKLDDYVGKRYRIAKKENETYAKIEQVEL